MAAGTVTLPISEETERKLRALAMLTGHNVGQIQNTLSQFLDDMITKQCIELLGGTPTQTLAIRQPEIELSAAPMTPRKKVTFADAHREALSKPNEEIEEAFSDLEVQDEVSGHALSGDRDEGGNLSLEEQLAQATGNQPVEDDDEDKTFRETFAHAQVRNVGNNAEAFIDEVLGAPEEHETDEIPSVTRGYAGHGEYGERPRAATKSFESRLRKGGGARIQAYTGDEE